jgi:hypothetical protein
MRHFRGVFATFFHDQWEQGSSPLVLEFDLRLNLVFIHFSAHADRVFVFLALDSGRPMLRTLERPMVAYLIDPDTGILCFLSPVLVARGETIDLLPDWDKEGYHRFQWREEAYGCVPEDLLASAAPPVIPIGEHSYQKGSSHNAVLSAGRQVLAQLASQLANGAKFEPGDIMPAGWTSSRRRIFVKVTREMLALASGYGQAWRNKLKRSS